MVLASEFGVLPLDPAEIITKGRLQPGKMFLVDTVAGRVISDDEIKHRVATERPYAAWLDENKIELDQLPPAKPSYKLESERSSSAGAGVRLHGRGRADDPLAHGAGR